MKTRKSWNAIQSFCKEVMQEKEMAERIRGMTCLRIRAEEEGQDEGYNSWTPVLPTYRYFF